MPSTHHTISLIMQNKIKRGYKKCQAKRKAFIYYRKGFNISWNVNRESGV